MRTRFAEVENVTVGLGLLRELRMVCFGEFSCEGMVRSRFAGIGFCQIG